MKGPRPGPSPHLAGPRISASGASRYSPYPTPPAPTHFLPELCVEAGPKPPSFFPGTQGGDSGQKPPSQGSDAPGCTAVSGCSPQTLWEARTGLGRTPGLTPGSPHGVHAGPHRSFMGTHFGGVTNTTAGSILISLPNNNLVSILSSRQLGELRHREVKSLVRGHTASKWRSWDPAPWQRSPRGRAADHRAALPLCPACVTTAASGLVPLPSFSPQPI